MVAAGLSPWTLAPGSLLASPSQEPSALSVAKSVLARQAAAVVAAARAWASQPTLPAPIQTEPSSAAVGGAGGGAPSSASFDLRLMSFPGAPLAVFMRAFAQVGSSWKINVPSWDSRNLPTFCMLPSTTTAHRDVCLRRSCPQKSCPQGAYPSA